MLKRYKRMEKMIFSFFFKVVTLQIMAMALQCINTINSRSHEFTVLSKWFYNNFVVLISDKYSFMLLSVDDELQIDSICGNETQQIVEKVLGVTINNRLNFGIHLLNTTKNANSKFNALTGGKMYRTTEQKKFFFY